ncbi:MAG: lysophospholipid acyltransferase family protein [Nitrospiraceae bacterium]
MRRPSSRITFRLLNQLNRLVCRVMYRVSAPPRSPLPEAGPVLLVSDHTSLSDPLVLLATAGRPIRFLMAREIYQPPHLQWVFRAFNCIPVTRGSYDVAAVRTMLRALRQGEVVGLFPEGGIQDYREESGHLGIGYLVLKTGAPVVPVSIAWDQVRPATLRGTLLRPGKAVVRYGAPMVLQPDPDPSRERIGEVTAGVMRAIRDLGAK